MKRCSACRKILWWWQKRRACRHLPCYREWRATPRICNNSRDLQEAEDHVAIYGTAPSWWIVPRTLEELRGRDIDLVTCMQDHHRAHRVDRVAKGVCVGLWGAPPWTHVRPQGVKVVVSDEVPPGTVEARIDGKVVGRIVNVAEAEDQGPSSSAPSSDATTDPPER